jgi:hypothetical protein
MSACMGGWCKAREGCAMYQATDRRWPVERMCEPRADGVVSAWRGLPVQLVVKADSEVSMDAKPQNPWTDEVHRVMHSDGLRLSASDIEQRFGRPHGKQTRTVIENAVQRGWFRAEGEYGKRVYVAVPMVPAFGQGIGKVRSVFELAEAQ